MIIINYLWDLNIESLSLAWNELYEQAKTDYKDGIITEIDSIIEGSKEVFADPITCRRLLVENFNEYSKRANQLKNDLKIDFSKESLNQLIQYDAILYNILSYWLDNLLDLSSMDPKYFMDELIESSMDHYLYTLTNPNPMLKHIDHYRLIQL